MVQTSPLDHESAPDEARRATSRCVPPCHWTVPSGAHPPISSPLPVSSGVINELEKCLVLCYSGTSRRSGDSIQRVRHAYLNGAPATWNALRTMRDVARRVKSARLAAKPAALAAAGSSFPAGPMPIRP
ncbi:MAG TPA: hypothetical protein VFZ66_03070 [Herpetosiphonaceae bacterium]